MWYIANPEEQKVSNYDIIIHTLHYNLTCYVLEFLESRFFQLFDLLLHHDLKGLIVDKSW